MRSISTCRMQPEPEWSPDMHTVTLVLLVIAFVLFVLSALNSPIRINLVAAGLACWVLTLILPSLHN